MKIVDLTGEGRGVVSFNTDLMPDGSVIGRFEVGTTTAEIPMGANAEGVPSIDEIQVKFDKPESVAVFIHQLQRGYNRMSMLQMQEQYLKAAMAKAKEDEAKLAHQDALKVRIEQMARELSTLQNEYFELTN